MITSWIKLAEEGSQGLVTMFQTMQLQTPRCLNQSGHKPLFLLQISK